ncbi:hypothetical protein [Polynucleobacter sp.]|uniref:hypothetical protein n=1 Tax=Polynucleobacter sp. TaxID=2029855 RepID=UPI003F6959A1
MILKKKHAVSVISSILLQIYEDRRHRFPERFDEFAYEIAKRLYAQFKVIEGNPIIFEKNADMPETMPLKIINHFELVEHREHSGYN